MELPDGSAFCPACGAQLGAQEAEAPAAAAPAASGSKLISLPKLTGWIKLGITTMTFLLSFLSWGAVSAFGYSQGFSIFGGSMFQVSVAMGFAKILMILGLFLFPVAIAVDLLNMDLLEKKNNIFGIAKKFGKLAYFGIVCFSLFLVLVGAIFTEFVTMGWAWYVSILFAVPGLILCFKPDLLGNFGLKD